MDLKLGDVRMIIDACIQEHLLRNACAYVLATAWHETAHTMKPIEEMGGQAYLRSKAYYPFFGRGYVQLTWEAGYRKASDKLGVDFVAHPELLLDPQYAAPILVIGMAEGWFTGKKLSNYIDMQHSDFVGARRIINGTDRANTIALYAEQFDALLKIEGYGEAPSVGPKPASLAPVQPVPVQPTPAPAPAAPVPPAPVNLPSRATIGVLVLIGTALATFWHELAVRLHSFF
jgi:hypothetical protein